MTTKNKNEAVPAAVEATPLLRTQVRQKVSPFLPPPVVVALGRLDAQLELVVGPEPTVTLMTSLLVCWVLYRLASFLGGSRGGKAFAMDDDDDENLKSHVRQHDESVLLCGPALGGKTSIFYYLVHDKSGARTRTVSSLKSNTGYIDVSQSKTVRVLDAPGRWGTDKLLRMSGYESMERIVIVLDSSQHAAKAADYLYAVFTRTSDLAASIMIACHKCKSPKAKNPRRIKLQLRSELERLDSLNKQASSIDWDEILQTKVSFCSSSCEPLQMESVAAFVRDGNVSGT